MGIADAIKLISDCCAGYMFEPVAVFKKSGDHPWPMLIQDENDLEAQLFEGGHFLPLPKEPAALANVVEVALVDFVIDQLKGTPGVHLTRGTERGYPDIELQMGADHYAVDVKVARRKVNKKGKPTGKTDSRITLYTGNTFFRYPKLKWAGTFRTFAEYKGHVDIIALYTLKAASNTRIEDFELIVVEPWRIGSRTRSSTTREYLGAVDNIQALRDGKGEFATQAEFYEYWRKFPFKIGKATQKQLDKLLAQIATD